VLHSVLVPELEPVLIDAALLDELWDAWTPSELAARMRDVSVPWCIVGGWAIDLFVGEQTREHEDLEFAVPQAHWPLVRTALAELEFLVAGEGGLFVATDDALDAYFQTWGRDDSGRFKVDVFREAHDDTMWVCKRDRSITRPYAEVICRTADGIPYMTPECTLLLKAKHDRDKDQHDLAACLPLMTPGQRAWLAAALSQVHPAHPWLDVVARSAG
jgi:hypothetical protein